MGAYVSRKYLKEKWNKLKKDMENYLEILNEELDDKVDEDKINQVKMEIYNNSRAINRELMKDE